MRWFIGLDIGGTKCAAVRGRDGRATAKIRFPTAGREETLARLYGAADRLIREGRARGEPPAAIGISCGGPLDARGGRILNPPNLPGWTDVPIVRELTRRTGLPAFLCNDANACALAEWRFGAGRGARSLVFLTFGTGMGAGLILDGRLYEGATGAAGEFGHVRLAPDGPVGFRKAGSVEGFCSGGGLAQAARRAASRALAAGRPPAFCPTEADLPSVTAESVAAAALADPPDELAAELYRDCGARLGQALAVLVDLLNPERIVIGSVFARSGALLIPSMRRALEAEALPDSLAACRIVPAELGESLGDAAALCAAEEGLRLERAPSARPSP